MDQRAAASAGRRVTPGGCIRFGYDVVMAATTTVRVTPDVRDRLSRIARERGTTTPAVIGELVRLEEERLEVQTWARDLEAMDSGELEAYRIETADLDGTAGDGLADVAE